MNNRFHFVSSLFPQFILPRWSGLASLATLALTITLSAEPANEWPAEFSSASAFDVAAEGGTVHLLLAQPTDDGTLALFFTKSTDIGQSWTSPVEIPTDHAPPGRHQRGHDPQLAVSGDRLIALWAAEGDGPWGGGPLATATSEDGGRTWQAGPGSEREAGVGFRFPALSSGKGAFHVVWIHAVGTDRSLRHARLEFGANSWSPPAVIDPSICACCWNQLKFTDDGRMITLYRDYAPSDMGFAISTDQGGSWEIQKHAGAFDWRFEGCPHVGGGLASGQTKSGNPLLLATVWTGHSEHAGAYILRSLDGGHSWDRQPIAENLPRGHINTDIALLTNGHASATWDAPQEGGARGIFVTESTDAGKIWGPPRQLSAAGTAGSHPRLVAMNHHDAFIALWTETTSEGKTRLVIAPIKPTE